MVVASEASHACVAGALLVFSARQLSSALPNASDPWRSRTHIARYALSGMALRHDVRLRIEHFGVEGLHVQFWGHAPPGGALQIRKDVSTTGGIAPPFHANVFVH